MSVADASDDAPPPRGWRPGPGLLVTAAFIGPGTVTTASLAGAKFGFALAWTLLLAVGAAIVLQEMAARLGMVARLGLAEAIRESITWPPARVAALALVLVAIVFGNTAYQTGNLIGAGMGLSVVTGISQQACAAVTGVAVAVLLITSGTGRWLQTPLIIIVLAMSVAFLATAFLASGDAAGHSVATEGSWLPAGSLLTALALVGTTVVPYNLFLHATAAKQNWPAGLGETRTQLQAARVDTVFAIGLGGAVTLAILTTAVAAFYGRQPPPGNALEMAKQLGPVLGPAGRWLFAAGLAAAGITSAITAPLAASYVVAGALPQAPAWLARLAAAVVALTGACLAASFGASPVQAIVLTQAANGLLLPLVAAFLLLVVNRVGLLGEHRNRWRLNAAGAAALLLTIALGVKLLATAF
ncbi:MAG: Nramp family divalent metal transporter [Planctomycetota bacterium]